MVGNRKLLISVNMINFSFRDFIILLKIMEKVDTAFKMCDTKVNIN